MRGRIVAFYNGLTTKDFLFIIALCAIFHCWQIHLAVARLAGIESELFSIRWSIR